MRIPTYSSPEAPNILRLEGKILKLNKIIRELKINNNIPWDHEDLVEGRCKVEEFRFQQETEVYVDA
jgi:glycerol-3-phosphate responsive antiterminator